MSKKMNTSIDIEGLKEFRKTLEELGIDFKENIKKAAMKAGREIAKKANAQAKCRGWTYDKYYTVQETRLTRKSDSGGNIKITTIRGKKGTAPAKNKIKWYKEQGDRYYAFFNEYGNKYQNEVPLLIPLFESSKENIESTINSELNKIIDKANGK